MNLVFSFAFAVLRWPAQLASARGHAKCFETSWCGLMSCKNPTSRLRHATYSLASSVSRNVFALLMTTLKPPLGAFAQPVMPFRLSSRCHVFEPIATSMYAWLASWYSRSPASKAMRSSFASASALKSSLSAFRSDSPTCSGRIHFLELPSKRTKMDPAGIITSADPGTAPGGGPTHRSAGSTAMTSPSRIQRSLPTLQTRTAVLGKYAVEPLVNRSSKGPIARSAPDNCSSAPKIGCASTSVSLACSRSLHS
mmetsp:Transcript_85755/g.239797  ORF Transcript_85755/g.239797 Transcript_85755/m.239797 type:complete len:253 (-) Transcript_85755:755-1513(-)